MPASPLWDLTPAEAGLGQAFTPLLSSILRCQCNGHADTCNEQDGTGCPCQNNTETGTCQGSSPSDRRDCYKYQVGLEKPATGLGATGAKGQGWAKGLGTKQTESGLGWRSACRLAECWAVMQSPDVGLGSLTVTAVMGCRPQVPETRLSTHGLKTGLTGHSGTQQLFRRLKQEFFRSSWQAWTIERYCFKGNTV